MQQTPRLRPLQFGEIIDGAFRLYTGNFKKLTIIAALVLLPLGLITVIAIDSMGFAELALTPELELTDEQAFGMLGRLFTGAFSTLIISIVGTALIQAASIRVYADTYQGIDDTWQNSMKGGLRRLGSVVVATILIGLGSSVALLFCIAPGVWLWTSWYATIPAMVTEGKGVIDSMTRSWNLVRPQFWQTVGIIVVTFLIVSAIQQMFGLVITLVFSPLIIRGGSDPTLIAEGFNQFLGLSTMLSTLIQIFTLPFSAAVATVVYFDLRVRSEGFDIEQLVREMGSSDGLEKYRPPPDQLPPDDPFGLDQADQ